MVLHCSVAPSFVCSLPRQVGHLTERQLAFFSRWDRTIDLEAKVGEQVKHENTTLQEQTLVEDLSEALNRVFLKRTTLRERKRVEGLDRGFE